MMARSALAGWRAMTALSTARCKGKDVLVPSLIRVEISKLVRNKAKAPLFDTDRSRRNLEAAYRRMTELAQRGEPPASFSVAEADQLAF